MRAGIEITGVETYTLGLPIDRTVGDSRLDITDMYTVVVELETDEGYTGTGWMNSLGFAPDLLERFVDSQFADIVVGTDPFATDALQDRLRAQTIYYVDGRPGPGREAEFAVVDRLCAESVLEGVGGEGVGADDDIGERRVDEPL